MSAGEKKVAALLAIVLVVMLGAYFVTGRSSAGPGGTLAQAGGAAGGATGGQACAPTPGAAGGGVPTQEFGKAGAKLEIVAALPITHGCHVETEAELKKAYEKSPEGIHLIIYDLFGNEGQEFVKQNGGQRAVVFINGESSFELNGKSVKLEVREGGSYVPSDIVPIIDQELKAS